METQLVTEPAHFAIRNAKPGFVHAARFGELWIVEYRAGFGFALDSVPTVTAHCAADCTGRELAALMQTRWHFDCAFVQTGNDKEKPGKLTYHVSLSAGRSRRFDVARDRICLEAIRVVREWAMYFQSRGHNDNDRPIKASGFANRNRS